MRYQQASILFEEYKNTFIDDRYIYDSEMQKWRREFMRAFAHRTSDRKEYIQYGKYCLQSILPSESASNKVWDFDLISKYNEVINHMEQF